MAACFPSKAKLVLELPSLIYVVLFFFHYSDRDEADGSENEHSDDGEFVIICGFVLSQLFLKLYPLTFEWIVLTTVLMWFLDTIGKQSLHYVVLHALLYTYYKLPSLYLKLNLLVKLLLHRIVEDSTAKYLLDLIIIEKVL